IQRIAMLTNGERTHGELGQRIVLVGLVIYVIFAPHSVAASASGAVIATLGWLLRTLQTRSLGLRWSKFDLIIVLSLLWTLLSALLSEEPRISIAKLTASWGVLLFYLARATVDRKAILALVTLLILTGCAGALYSVFDLVRGRGVVVEQIAVDSPFQQVGILPGDNIWHVNRHRIYSKAELDDALKSFPANTPLLVGIISRGEQVERTGMVLTPAQNAAPSPSGIQSNGRDHFFRASGWTRHYETFAELLQMIALLGLGLALAHLKNHGPNR